MKKKIVGIITSMTMLISAMPQVIVNAAEEITISTAEELKAFADSVNSGDTYGGKTVTLTEDIDLSEICGADINGDEVSWMPIGTAAHQFNGTFNGENHEIKNLYINSEENHIGLFGVLGNGKIQDLAVTGYVKGNDYVGGLAGYDHEKSYIINCKNNAEIVGNGDFIGGIIGTNSGRIRQCSNYGNISGGGFYTGGIAGDNGIMPNQSERGIIANCYNAGAITNTGDDYERPDKPNGTGGIVGMNWTAIVQNCCNVGSVTALNNYAGGIVGSNFDFNYEGGNPKGKSTVSNCYTLKTANINTDINAVGYDFYSEDTTAYEKNSEQFATGEIAYLLNGSKTGGLWYQDIGQDISPMLDSTHSLVAYNEESGIYYNPDEFKIDDDYIYADTFRKNYLVGYMDNSNDDIAVMVAEYSDKGVLLSIGSHKVSHYKGDFGQNVGELTDKAKYIKIFAWKNGFGGMQPACPTVTYMCEDIPISDAD